MPIKSLVLWFQINSVWYCNKLSCRWHEGFPLIFSTSGWVEQEEPSQQSLPPILFVCKGKFTASCVITLLFLLTLPYSHFSLVLLSLLTSPLLHHLLSEHGWRKRRRGGRSSRSFQVYYLVTLFIIVFFILSLSSPPSKPVVSETLLGIPAFMSGRLVTPGSPKKNKHISLGPVWII